MTEELRAELLRRMGRDQAARRRLTPDGSGAEEMAAADAENLPWLRQVVADVGWPGRSMVGTDAAHAAWLLAQHADSDPAFQRRCLDLLTEAVARGEATRQQLAYLTDRVLLAAGKRQEYGTQMRGQDGRYVPCRLRDPDGVDERRAAVSLPPLAEYAERMLDSYGPPRPQTLTCPGCGAAVSFWVPEPGESVEASCPSCGRSTTVTVPATPTLPFPRRVSRRSPPCTGAARSVVLAYPSWGARSAGRPAAIPGVRTGRMPSGCPCKRTAPRWRTRRL